MVKEDIYVATKIVPFFLRRVLHDENPEEKKYYLFFLLRKSVRLEKIEKVDNRDQSFD